MIVSLCQSAKGLVAIVSTWQHLSPYPFILVFFFSLQQLFLKRNIVELTDVLIPPTLYWATYIVLPILEKGPHGDRDKQVILFKKEKKTIDYRKQSAENESKPIIAY